jgi:hypothetical protein
MQLALGQAVPFCQAQYLLAALDSFVSSFYSWHFFTPIPLSVHRSSFIVERWILNGESDIQHSFHAPAVRLAHQRAVYELSHSLSRLLGKDVASMAMAAQYFSCSRYFKTLCCTPACLLLHGYFSQLYLKPTPSFSLNERVI